MSFIAKLQLQNEEEISVMRCGFHFKQPIDVSGHPAAIPQGGTINLLLVSNSHAGLFDWMISPLQTKNGKITFLRYDTMSKLKILEFENAYCIEYHETFDQSGEHPMQVQLTLSARIVKLDDSTFKNNWPG